MFGAGYKQQQKLKAGSKNNISLKLAKGSFQEDYWISLGTRRNFFECFMGAQSEFRLCCYKEL